MPDIRALDEPLSDTELDELEAFLASDAVPQDCMDLEMLDGYLTAIASGPES
ncbi:MAG: YecA family protein, partial [Betaproteobacteria bacterium]|nr:YecA family protein [Betaproteobacteria bacterium]